MNLVKHSLVAKVLLITGALAGILIWYGMISLNIQSLRPCSEVGFDIFCGQQWSPMQTLFYSLAIIVLLATIIFAVMASARDKTEISVWRVLIILSLIPLVFYIVILWPVLFDGETWSENMILISAASLTAMGTIATITLYRRMV